MDFPVDLQLECTLLRLYFGESMSASYLMVGTMPDVFYRVIIPQRFTGMSWIFSGPDHRSLLRTSDLCLMGEGCCGFCCMDIWCFFIYSRKTTESSIQVLRSYVHFRGSWWPSTFSGIKGETWKFWAVGVPNHGHFWEKAPFQKHVEKEILDQSGPIIATSPEVTPKIVKD